MHTLSARAVVIDQRQRTTREISIRDIIYDKGILKKTKRHNKSTFDMRACVSHACEMMRWN